MPNEKILIVDDDRNLRYSLKRMFEGKDIDILEAKSGREALDYINSGDVDLVLMDIRMPGASGLDILKQIRNIKPKQLVIIMTAYGTTQTAIEAMKFGAFDYVLKPFDIPKMWEIIEKALNVNRLMKTSVSFSEEENDGFSERIVGCSPQMQEVYKMIGQVAEKDVTVLIRGESGTGKELVARAIYHHSRRKGKPYLPVNCAAIPEALLESELFGYEKGAFTDAHMHRIGKFEQCNGGTIFLDEIGDMSLATQAKVLRALQEKEISRLGSNEIVKVDVRLIIATNKNLEQAIQDGTFREDLYYRLNVVTITLPPLRERKSDIPELVEYFIRRFTKELGKEMIAVSPEAMEKLLSYHWPGNVRELENIIKRACVLCKGSCILPEEFSISPNLSKKVYNKTIRTQFDTVDRYKDIEQLLDELYKKIISIPKQERGDIFPYLERAIIIRALRETGGNQLKTARLLGINRATLRNKIDRFGIKISMTDIA